MPSSSDTRKHPRITIRVPNSLRLKVQDEGFMADLLDISQGGVGAEYFDLLDALMFTDGDIVKLEFLLKPEQVNNKSASEILATVRGQKTTDEKGTETTKTLNSGEESFETDAKIVWTYLNRLGLEFIKAD